MEGINRNAWLDTIPKIESKLNSDILPVPIVALAKVEEAVTVNSISEILEIPRVPFFPFDVDTVPPPHFKDMEKAMKQLESMEQQMAKSLQQLEEMDFMFNGQMEEISYREHQHLF